MPPKTCICAVCGENVLKSQTVAIANNQRVCKSHNEADQAKDFQNKQKETLATTRIRRKKHNFAEDFEQRAIDARETCYCCGSKGHRIDIWLQLHLNASLNIQALTQLGAVHQQATDAALNVGDLKNRRALFLINDVRWVTSKVQPQFKPTVSFGFGMFCLDCINKIGLTRQYKHQYPTPKFSLESMAAMAAATDYMVKERKDALKEAIDYFKSFSILEE